jgi:hypothetical protein
VVGQADFRGTTGRNPITGQRNDDLAHRDVWIGQPSAMNTMSESATRLQPHPIAGPLKAATVGTRHATMAMTIRRPSTSDSFRRPASLCSSSG